jgi:hypothetical protein
VYVKQVVPQICMVPLRVIPSGLGYFPLDWHYIKKPVGLAKFLFIMLSSTPLQLAFPSLSGWTSLLWLPRNRPSFQFSLGTASVKMECRGGYLDRRGMR